MAQLGVTLGGAYGEGVVTTCVRSFGGDLWKRSVQVDGTGGSICRQADRQLDGQMEREGEREREERKGRRGVARREGSCTSDAEHQKSGASL